MIAVSEHRAGGGPRRLVGVGVQGLTGVEDSDWKTYFKSEFSNCKFEISNRKLPALKVERSSLRFRESEISNSNL